MNKMPGGWLDRRGIKEAVREKLSGKLLPCFFACLLPMILPWAMRLIPSGLGVKYFLLGDLYLVGISVPMTVLSFVAMVFVTDPMQVRLAAFFLKLHTDKEHLPPPQSVCDCFGAEYWRVVRGMLLRSVYVFCLVLPFAAGLLLPGAVTSEVMDGISYTRIGIHPAFVLLGLLAWLYGSVSSCMVRYLLASQEGATAREALRRSRRLVHGRFLEMVTLEASFLPWMFATVLLLLPAIFFWPYYEGTFAAYYLAMTAQRPAPARPGDGDAA